MPRSATFTAHLQILNQPYSYPFVEVPHAVAEPFQSEGITRIRCSVNGKAPYACALKAQKGGFFISLSRQKAKAFGVRVGELLSLEIFEDESEYGMDMPEELQAVIDQEEAFARGWAAMW